MRTQTQSPLGISNTFLYDKESWPACYECGPGTPHTSKGLSLSLGPASHGGMRIKKDIGCTDVLNSTCLPSLLWELRWKYIREGLFWLMV